MAKTPLPLLLDAFRWFYREFGLASIHATGRDAYLIILARTCRMFAYGTSSLILAIFFSALDISDQRIGLFMTLTMVGDVLLGTSLTLVADRVGRRRVMIAGSLLMVLSGSIFALCENYWALLFGAVVGVISATGGDFGPFRSIEESMLSQLTTPATRSDVLAWHVSTPLLGSSLGSEVAGRILHYLHDGKGWTEVDAYHAIFWIYALMGVINLLLALPLTKACELRQADVGYARISQDARYIPEPEPLHHNEGKGKGMMMTWFSNNFALISSQTRKTMYTLWLLLALDSLADGMVPYSLTNYFLDTTFHPSKSVLGDVTSASYFLGGIGATLASPLSRRIGLVNTMVFTHIPSSLAVLLFPFPPYFPFCALLLLVRAALNSMDQAPRTALIAAVVREDERTAVMGITSAIRSIAAMLGPLFTGYLAAGNRFWVAFVVAGLARLGYDLGLYALFVNIRLYQHEQQHTEGDDDDEDVELGSFLTDSEDDGHESTSKTGGTKETRDGNGNGRLLSPPHSRVLFDVENHRERSRSRSPYRAVDM
ncbi:major facilitator superfamily domain-containing protein [Poronia punctata]|nr:major facilitator superfamily domain-containing protein [Poronia punctata]